MTAQSNAKSYISRILSFLMALIVTVNIVTPTALAATYKQKSVTSSAGTSKLSKMTNFKVTTGKGIAYTFGWKKTVMTIKNTGRYPVTVWQQTGIGVLAWKGTLNPGQTWNWSMSGSAKEYVFYFQRGRGNTNISVSVNAGSVS